MNKKSPNTNPKINLNTKVRKLTSITEAKRGGERSKDNATEYQKSSRRKIKKGLGPKLNPKSLGKKTNGEMAKKRPKRTSCLISLI